MKLNTKITIESVYNEDTDSNSISFSADLDMTASEFMTTLELAKNNMLEFIKSGAEKIKIEDINDVQKINDWMKKVTLEELYNSVKKNE